MEQKKSQSHKKAINYQDRKAKFQKKDGTKTLFISITKSFEDLYAEVSSSDTDSDSEGSSGSGAEQWWDPSWVEDPFEHEHRRKWEAINKQKEEEWEERQKDKKSKEMMAFKMWSKRWDLQQSMLMQAAPAAGEAPSGKGAKLWKKLRGKKSSSSGGGVASSSSSCCYYHSRRAQRK